MNSLKILLPALIVCLILQGTHAFAAGRLKVTETGVLNADADEVWSLIGDFGGLPNWIPGIASSTMQGSPTDAGSTRTLTVGNGFQITEALVDYSAAERSYSYVVIGGVGGNIKNYLSTLRVEPTGAGSSRVIWSATFDPVEGITDAAAIEGTSNIYKGAIEGLKKKINME